MKDGGHTIAGDIHLGSLDLLLSSSLLEDDDIFYKTA
jgi:hypothetical protein